MSETQPTLKRSMGLMAVTIYGVGDMLGAGIYGQVGVAAREMGNTIWMAYALSALAALLTGLTYASLGSRYPRAAGAAYVTHRAFNWTGLAYVLGLAVLASGLTSMATGTQVVTGYLCDAMGLKTKLEGGGTPYYVYLFFYGYLALIMLINLRGIKESTWANALCTTVEVSGLLIIIAVGVRYWGGVDYLETPVVGNVDGEITRQAITLPFLMSGAVLTFFAFIGFEDLLNVSEEVKNPKRNFPLGLIMAVVIATLIYMAIAITAVSVVPHEKLAKSTAPMVDVMKVAAPWFPAFLFTFISIFAVANTGLLNYIMGSRLLYGMANQGLLPRGLARVHPTRHTPHVAILVILLIVAVLVLLGDIGALAAATSTLLLLAFTVVNVAWVVLKNRAGEPRGGFECPRIVSAAGAVVCLSLVGARIYEAQSRLAAKGFWEAYRPLLIAAGILVVITLVYVVRRIAKFLANV